jgi:hypothetical protein
MYLNFITLFNDGLSNTQFTKHQITRNALSDSIQS